MGWVTRNLSVKILRARNSPSTRKTPKIEALEIRKLKQSNKLKDLELESKNLIINRLSTANNYLVKTAKSEDE
jgi:hypothetical protein